MVGGPAIRSQIRDFNLGFDRDGPLARFNPTYRDDLYDDLIVYEDRRPNFITSEPALSYSSSALLLFATLAR